MRGDLNVQLTPVTNFIAETSRMAFDGDRAIPSDTDGVKIRKSQKSFRVAVNQDVLDNFGGVDVGDEIGVVFKMTLGGRLSGRSYVLVPAGDRKPHGVIKVRG